MLADWTAECAAEDPVLVVPWNDPDSPAHFIDLRENPYDLDQIPEADQYPPLMQALRSLNAPRSPVFTAKCDVWPLAPDDLTSLHLELDLTPADNPTGLASYIDLLPRDRALFASIHLQRQFADRLVRRASALNHPQAALECTLRPALIDLTGVQEGFALSLYIKAIAHDPETAAQHWAAALEAVVSLLRGKDLATA